MTVRFILAAVLLACGLTVPLLAATYEGSSLIFPNPTTGGAFRTQGVCAANGMKSADINATDFQRATWACTGISDNMLRIFYKDGPQECVYIDNKFNDEEGTSAAFFVPLSTSVEWLQFKANRPASISINYGCPGGIYQDECGNNYVLPEMRACDDEVAAREGKACEVVTIKTSGDYEVQFKCSAKTMAPAKLKVGENIISAAGCREFVKFGEKGTCTRKDIDLSFSGNACTSKVRPTDLVIALDTSGSMDKLVDAARNSLRTLVTQYLQGKPDVRLTITAIGGAGYADRSTAEGEQCYYGRIYGPASAISSSVDSLIGAVKTAFNTPLAASVSYGTSFYTDATRRKVMLLLSDGIETCTNSTAPEAAVKDARSQGIEIFGIKYGVSAGFAGVDEFFAAMNQYSAATAEADIFKAIEKTIKDVVTGSCKATLHLYDPATNELRYTLISGDKSVIKSGRYNAVVDYCTGTRSLPNQDFTASREFTFNEGCK